jgi:metal-responsive CopG/Arc/MetJ family transcriptional regulator
MSTTLLTFRVPDDLVAQLDDLVARAGASRSEVLRALIADAVGQGDDLHPALIRARMDAALAALEQLAQRTQGAAPVLT